MTIVKVENGKGRIEAAFSRRFELWCSRLEQRIRGHAGCAS